MGLQHIGGVSAMGQKATTQRILFFITHQFSLRIPDLQAVPVDYVVIRTHGGFKRQFERLKCLHGMASVSRDAKWSVYVMALSGFSEKICVSGLLVDLASSFPHLGF